MVAAFSELLGARDLLRTFLTRDLSVRYKGSALGIAWSLLNPLLLMAVYTVVFSEVMRVDLENYPIFFLAGFLPWTFFATTLQMGSASLVSHASLIQKVYFPREVLPLSIALANLVNLAIALAIYMPVAFWVVGVDPLGLVALAFVGVCLTLFTAGITMIVSALVVYFRDIEFLLSVVMTAWFFLTPVVYPIDRVPSDFRILFDLNPMTPFVRCFQDVLYATTMPSATSLLACLVLGPVAFLASYAGFNRLKGRVAEEL